MRHSHLAKENETPAKVAALHSVPVRAVVALNRDEFPNLGASTKLRADTLLRRAAHPQTHRPTPPLLCAPV